MKTHKRPQTIFQILSGKHTAMVLVNLHNMGSIRFMQITNLMKISAKIMDAELKHLVFYELVVRDDHGHKPKHHVEYSLTEYGREVVEPLLELLSVARSNTACGG